MARKHTHMIVASGRPSDYSDDMLNKIAEHLQAGMTLREISRLEGMPTFMTFCNWRRTRPEFFYTLCAVDEDLSRESGRNMRNVAMKLEEAVAELDPAGILENYQAVKATIDSLEKVAKVQIVKGDAPPPNDHSEEIQRQRRQLADLHPMTQDKIRRALQEDRELRGEGEDDE